MKGLRGKGTSRFMKSDSKKFPELKLSKIVEKYRTLTKCLEKKKLGFRVTPNIGLKDRWLGGKGVRVLLGS